MDESTRENSFKEFFFNQGQYGNRPGIARGGSNREESQGKNRNSNEIPWCILISLILHDVPDTVLTIIKFLTA